MSDPKLIIGIVYNADKPEAFALANQLLENLHKVPRTGRGGLVMPVHTLTYRHNDRELVSHLTSLEESGKCPLIVVIGGDGTIIGVARRFYNIPILGINCGKLGFLAEFNVEEAIQWIDLAIIREEIEVNIPNYSILKASPNEEQSLGELPAVWGKTAINEFTFYSSSRRLIRLSVEIRQYPDPTYYHLTEIEADGLLVATVIGSTAYNLSAKGPLLLGGSNFALTPLYPHVFSLCPVVIPAPLDLLIKPHNDCDMIVDGQDMIGVRAESAVHIENIVQGLRLVRNRKNPYLSLHEKLNWGIPKNVRL